MKALIFLVGLLSGVAEAQEVQKDMHGAGGQSCGKYTDAVDTYRPYLDGQKGTAQAWAATANYWQYEEWIEGYVQGIDSFNPGPTSRYDNAGMRVWIYQWCQKNPLKAVANAAWSFWHEIGGKPPQQSN